MNKRISALLLGTALVLGVATGASAQDKNVKIGSLSDQSSLYADVGGPGSTLAAQMAVEDSGLTKKGWNIEVISGDHQNKPDVGSNIARQWYDVDKVDVIVDVPNSGVALAVSNVTKDKNKIFINSGAATSDLTNAQCTPNTVHWTYDTYNLAHGTGGALVKAGGDSWFFLTADYAFGAALERDTAAVVKAEGGKVLGGVKHPLNTSDFSSFLLQAQASKAKIIGLANAGGDTTNSIKQAAEFGIVAGRAEARRSAALYQRRQRARSQCGAGAELHRNVLLGPERPDPRVRQALLGADEEQGTCPPWFTPVSTRALLHYLKVLEAQGGNSHDGAKIVAAMKAMPTDDPLFGKGTIEPNGRKIHPAYLFEVKKPSESKGPWDYYKLVVDHSGRSGVHAARARARVRC